MMDVSSFIEQCHRECAEEFCTLERTALKNQERVLRAFWTHRVSPHYFNPTTGYGYDDIGRDGLGRVVATVFETESAIASPLLTGGTHAIVTALFGVLRARDTLLSVTGAPYDTLKSAIHGEGIGSLKDFGVKYKEVELLDGEFDFERILAELKDSAVKVVFVQRSRGYNFRKALSMRQIGELQKRVKSVRPDVCVMVDNCYGEFVEDTEPTAVGADVAIGSFIKNIGGGIAPTGGYIAGKTKWIEQISGRLTAPGVGGEVGSYAYGYLPFYQGLFLAPHTVLQSLKGSALIGRAMSKLGYEVSPPAGAPMCDIVRSVKFRSSEELIAFCQAIQSASPVDGHVVPEAWDMPGYENQVIMAAGTFIGGASIELSCDAPIRAPYIAYIQGGLTYEHVRIALGKVLEKIGRDL